MNQFAFQQDTIEALVRKEKILQREVSPRHGYLFCPEVHVHLIPPYAGDVANPVGGVRGIISGQGSYL
jgi:hypothetical protein